MNTPVKERGPLEERSVNSLVGKKRQRKERSGLTPEEKKKKQKANDGKLFFTKYMRCVVFHVCHPQGPK